MACYLGVNIGGTTCSVCRGNEKGEIVTRTSFSNPGEVNACLAALTAAAADVMIPDVIAAGISCGGPLDAERGIVQSPPNLPGWDNIEIVKIISAAIGKPAYLMNDANAGGLAEWLYGTGGKCPSLVFLTCGTGLGSGIVIDGKILEGVNGNGGEVGHIRLTDDGPLGYHKHGSFEGWGCGSGFKQFAGRDAKTAADAARKGDAKAIADFARMGEMMGRGLAIIIDTLNPARIVIGGVYMRCEDLIRPAMMKAIEREALPQSAAVCELAPSVCGEAIGDMSALAIAQYYAPGNEVDLLVRRYPALAVCAEAVERTCAALIAAFNAGGQVLLAGNGGSHADAHHIAGELLKSFRHKRRVTEDWVGNIGDVDIAEKLEKALPARVLGASSAFTTAFENDSDAKLVLAQEVSAVGKPGDVFIGISTSGHAANVCAAAKVAKAKGLTVVALTGKTGGPLADLSDIAVKVPETETYRVQELHLPVYHAICAKVERLA